MVFGFLILVDFFALLGFFLISFLGKGAREGGCILFIGFLLGAGGVGATFS